MPSGENFTTGFIKGKLGKLHLQDDLSEKVPLDSIFSVSDTFWRQTETVKIIIRVPKLLAQEKGRSSLKTSFRELQSLHDCSLFQLIH